MALREIQLPKHEHLPPNRAYPEPE
jgi:hypothetical protein